MSTLKSSRHGGLAVDSRSKLKTSGQESSAVPRGRGRAKSRGGVQNPKSRSRTVSDRSTNSSEIDSDHSSEIDTELSDDDLNPNSDLNFSDENQGEETEAKGSQSAKDREISGTKEPEEPKVPNRAAQDPEKNGGQANQAKGGRGTKGHDDEPEEPGEVDRNQKTHLSDEERAESLVWSEDEEESGESQAESEVEAEPHLARLNFVFANKECWTKKCRHFVHKWRPYVRRSSS